MDAEIVSFLIVLSLLWFLVYWILGGVFFAVITLMRLGRIRKVRFSCLFSILSFVLGIGTAYVGVSGSENAVSECLVEATTKAEKVVAVFGCGFASIFGTFLLGAVVLSIGGFLIMAVSKSKTKPWITLDLDEEPAHPEPEKKEAGEAQSSSEFF